MSKNYVNNIVIENADIMFKNFSGRETKYNREGNRNFCVVIDDPDQAQALAEDGWNIRFLAPREEGERPIHYLQVAVRFDVFPPNVYKVTKKNKVLLDEESINCLDKAELRNVDLVIRPRQWDVGEKTGIKAYLKTGYFVLEEDEFADKYTNLDFPEDEPF